MTSQFNSPTPSPIGSTNEDKVEEEETKEGTVTFQLNPLAIVANLERQDPDLQGNGLASKFVKEGGADPS